VATGAVAAVTDLSSDRGLVAATAALVTYAGWRTVRLLPTTETAVVNTPALLFDLGLGIAAVSASGGWKSPYVFQLLVGVLIAGFSGGYAGGLSAAGLAAAGLATAAVVVPSARSPLADVSQVLLVFGASAVVAGYARRLFLDVQEHQQEFTDRVARLTEANALLSQLALVAQTLPSSLDLDETLSAAAAALREMVPVTAAAVLILDPTTETWTAAKSEGLRPPPPVPTRELPLCLRRAAVNRAVVTAEDLVAGRFAGLAPLSRSGLYAPLVSRGRLVALLAVEHEEPGRYGRREEELVAGFSEPLALNVDNALWFARLQSLGAEAERSRIARDLHDRVGQGLAYVGLELERLARTPEPGPGLARLREDVRGLLGEIRETLRQLRASVSESRDLSQLARDHLSRLADRTGMAVDFDDRSGGRRLPVPVEQELWRILQEALSNVERHSQADQVVVSWSVEGPEGRLEIRDDGLGLPSEAMTAGMGLQAMRERAGAIGARLAVASHSGGTCVKVDVEVPR
jgi:signal transduction histidine kinase